MNIKFDSKKVSNDKRSQINRKRKVIISIMISCLLFFLVVLVTVVVLIGSFIIQVYSTRLYKGDPINYLHKDFCLAGFRTSKYENLQMPTRLRCLNFELYDEDGIMYDNCKATYLNISISSVTIRITLSPKSSLKYDSLKHSCIVDEFKAYLNGIKKEIKFENFDYSDKGYNLTFKYTSSSGEKVSLDEIRNIFSLYIYYILADDSGKSPITYAICDSLLLNKKLFKVEE